MFTSPLMVMTGEAGVEQGVKAEGIEDGLLLDIREDVSQQHTSLLKRHISADFSKEFCHGDASFMQHGADNLSEAEPHVRNICMVEYKFPGLLKTDLPRWP